MRGPLLVGVVADQPLEIVHRAAELALSLDVKLICAYVDVTSYLYGESETGPGDDSEAVSAGIPAGLELILNQAMQARRLQPRGALIASFVEDTIQLTRLPGTGKSPQRVGKSLVSGRRSTHPATGDTMAQLRGY